MKLSDTVSKFEGVTQATAVMATPLNKGLLADIGFGGASIVNAATDDLIVAVEARDARALDRAMAEIERLLSPAELSPQAVRSPTNLAEALIQMPDANLALISVPGRFAKREATRALERNLNVFLFSSNVGRKDESELKRMAKKKGLLMMGPDCGTAIINRMVLGFGNVVRPGTIGLVSASGTGLQEVSTLIHKAGLGISHGIGTGGGDLSDEVGGISMIEGIKLLERDEATKTIVLISKPPGTKTAEKVLKAAKACKKPVVVNFLGSESAGPEVGNVRYAKTLEDAAGMAAEWTTRRTLESPGLSPELLSAGGAEYSKLSERQLFIRGLFSGGTLCYEAQIVLQSLVSDVYSNFPLDPKYWIDGQAPSKANVCIDMGAEEFVVGRPHPMIDFTLRKRRILQDAIDPQTAVILLDIELGYGSNPDPASELLPVIGEAKAAAKEGGRHISFVASVVGTDSDFQGLDEQERRLRESGVLIGASNAQAARLAAFVALRGKVS